MYIAVSAVWIPRVTAF